MKFLICICLVISTCTVTLCAQDIRKETSADLVRIREAYDKLSSLSMNINYKFYSSYSAESPVEKHTGYYCKQGSENSYLDLYGTLTVSNKDLVMVKDDSAMVFMVKKHFPEDAPQLTHDQFEKLLAVCSSVEKINDKGQDISGYRMLFKNNINGLSKLEFLFNTKSYLVTRIIMYYDRPVVKSYHTNTDIGYAKPKLEVEYVNVNVAPELNRKQFSVTKYLHKGKEKWELTSAYARSYELYDQTQVKLK